MSAFTGSITPIRVAIVGLGKIGARYDITNPKLNLSHASAISSDNRFKLVCGSDPNESYREDFERAYHVPSSGGIGELMSLVSPQVVVIATQTKYHKENLKELQAYQGISYILCEKPIVQETNGLAEVLRQASRQGQKIVVNYQRRTESSSKEIRMSISEKKFGKLLGGTGFYSGGYFNNASHMLDLIEWWFDTKLTIARLVDVSSHFDDHEVSLVSKIGDANFFLNSINSPSTSFFEIYLQFENCQLRYCSGGSQIFIDRILSNQEYPEYKSTKVSRNPVYVENKQNLSSVYEEIFRGMHGRHLSLPSATSALDLIERMHFFIK